MLVDEDYRFTPQLLAFLDVNDYHKHALSYQATQATKDRVPPGGCHQPLVPGGCRRVEGLDQRLQYLHR